MIYKTIGRACKGCAAWEPDDTGKAGLCRAMPPVADPHTFEGNWPMTNEQDWCCHWQGDPTTLTFETVYATQQFATCCES